MITFISGWMVYPDGVIQNTTPLGGKQYEKTGHGVANIVRVYGKEAFQITDNYINVVIPFDKEVVEEHNNSKNVGVNVGVKLPKTEKRIYELVKDNESITLAIISKELELSKRTIERNIKSLQDKNIVERIGSDKSGRWIVKK